MKKIIVVVAVLTFLLSEKTFAQIEIQAYTGWVPSSKTTYNYNGYRLRIEGSQNYGGGIGMTTPVGLIEFNYMGYSSSLSQDGGIVDVVDTQPINISYYHLGILKTLMEHEKLVPYGMFTLGATQFNPQDYVDQWKFSIALGLGLRYFFTPAIGIRLQARLLMPMYFAGAGFGCGTGGCSSGAYFGVDIFQGDFTGGVVIKINTQ